MADSPVVLLCKFLFAAVFTWLFLFLFVLKPVSWILRRKLGLSVRLRWGGWKCLRDVVVAMEKGPVESISVGEIKPSFRQSLVKHGFISRAPKLQILVCDIEIVLRPSVRRASKEKTKKQRPSGWGKWMAVKLARFFPVSVTDLVLKTPKATVEIKELKVDISEDCESKQNLIAKLHILHIAAHKGELQVSCDQSSNINSEGCLSESLSSCTTTERSSTPLFCDEFSLSCEFGHDREVGVVIKDVDIVSGEVTVNLNEEMLSKSKSSSQPSSQSNEVVEGTVATLNSGKESKKQSGVAALSKYSAILPEKFSFKLPKLDVKFMHHEHDLFVENNIMGIQLKSIKSQASEDVGESTRLDVQLDFSEIHLLREAGTSVLEILKVDVVSFVYIPIQPLSPVRAEVDVKLGGTRCNIIISRLKPWLRLHFSKKKKMVLREETSAVEKPPVSDVKAIMWTCTISAPEMTFVLYSINDMPLYHGCSQSSHVFANNISNTGTTVHMELGELNLHMAEEYQDCLKENLFGVESNSGSLMHVAKVSLDWGKREMESSEEDGPRSKLILSVDITGMGVYLTFKRAESLMSTAISFQALLKSLSGSGKRASLGRGGRSSKPSGKGTRLMKFNLERCSVNFCGDSGLENRVVADPKRVNYGSQGGRVVISVCSDGKPRCADVMSTAPDECKKLKYSVSLDIFHFSLCVNKEKQSTQVELERARSIYQEYLEGQKPETKVTLFDMQNSKFVRRSGGHKEIGVCSLFSATDIAVRWEPDVHIALFELGLQLKSVVHNQKLQQRGSESLEDLSLRDGEEKKGSISELGPHEKHKKKESIFAVDIEMLSISAEAGDGVDALIRVQSIFSENARIGVLLEGLILSLNGSRVLKSSRLQISRIPSVPTATSDVKIPVPTTTWDWVIQGLDIHICMPYRLQLRAIDDSFEDMLRALKLITAAKTDLIFPVKKDSSKPKKPSSVKVGRLKFCIRKLTADIEEEPLQGWLDEHYQLMKNEAAELAVRLKFLDELTSNQTSEVNDPSSERKFCFNGTEIDVQDPSAVSKVKEEIYKQLFRSYYKACQNLSPSEGSGACLSGFQSGFKPSTGRTSLLSITATDLDLSLTRIDGDEEGMIEFLKKVDKVCSDNNIPFSRLYGRNIKLQTSSLVVQLRDYTFPLFSTTSGKCEGRVVLAQQATCFQPQIHQDVFVGRWRKVRMLRSASGTTPPVKTYSDLPLHFQKGELSFGVGYEPAFADVSYAFTVALRRANLSLRDPDPSISQAQPPKKERSLPWWDDVRNYIHGNITLFFSETRWNVLGTVDPYEKLDKLQIVSTYMEIKQSDGRVYISAKDFKILLSSLESLASSRGVKLRRGGSGAFIEAPVFTLEVTMDWECESGSPLNHYLHALPIEGNPREKVYDPFRSTSLSLRWNFSFKPSPSSEKQSPSSLRDTAEVSTGFGSPVKRENNSVIQPAVNFGAHDLAWMMRFWNMNYIPPHKLRSFSRWPRFGVPRATRSGNLSMDKVMTEFMLRIAATPTCIRHMPLDDDDPAKGLTFNMTKLKYEICYSRGKQKYTFECRRDPLDLVYQGLDLHMPKAFLNREDNTTSPKVVQSMSNIPSASSDRNSGEKSNHPNSCTEKHRDDGFLLSSDYFTIRRQAPKADPARLLTWQEAGRKNLETTYVRSEFENGSESDEHTRSDPSDDDGYNVLIADNCQRVFVYGLKLLWTIENRDAVWSWVGGLSKAFEPPKPSLSRLYAQRKLLKENQSEDGISKPLNAGNGSSVSAPRAEASGALSSPSNSVKVENSLAAEKMEGSSSTPTVKDGKLNDSEEDGTRHFMVNVIEPQFNLHSEEANGRFLLAAVSGRVLARSFHSVLHVGLDVIEQALGTENIHIPECEPEMTWKRMELSVMLEHVQAHVAPTDVDPGAGLQWLPKIRRSSPKVKRTGALLERVFMPCDMYFQYTRHKGGTPELKVKPLKELSFNSDNISATMTSRQFQVMLDVLTNLLFARLPKPRKSSLSFPAEDDDVEEEADEMVPDGVEEVELARVNLEQKERERKLILNDIKKLSLRSDTSGDVLGDKDGELWMVSGARPILVQGLKRELSNAQKSRKAASASLRTALQKAAQLRLMEKEKNKSPSYAMRISLKICKVVWSMLVDGKSFAEAEINDMIYDFDRDYKDVGVAQFTTKYFVVRNCLPNAKSDMLLSAWNPPPEWGKKVMLRVDAKQGAPKEGNSPLELFRVEIYPLKIHLTETMYRMMWEYFFPEEEQDSQRRQEVWKVSTTAGSKRVKKGSSTHEASTSSSHSTKEIDFASKLNSLAPSGSQPNLVDSASSSKLNNPTSNSASGSISELRRTSSFDRSWEETVAESVATELVFQSISGSRSSLLDSSEPHDESSKNKSKDPKTLKTGRSSHEEKKITKSSEEKRSRPRKLMEFHDIKISQVELLVTYEGSRFVVNDLKLLMDTFHRVEFTGTWRRLFSRVKKHIIWGVLKSVTGMQGKKFKDKAHSQRDPNATSVPDIDLNFSDNEGQIVKSDQHPMTWPKRPNDGAGDGFVTSIRGLFNTQRRKAKAFVLRTMRGEAENDYQGDWSESDAESSPFARQLTIISAKRLIRRHTKKFRSRGQKASTSQQKESLPSSPRETTPFESDYSSGSSPYEDFHE